MMTLSALLRGVCLFLLAVSSYSACGLSYNATIRDCTGKPLSGTVVLQQFSGTDGYARPRSACTRTLDSAGRLACDNMTPGRYAVILLVGAATPSEAVTADTPRPAPSLPTPLLTRETEDEGFIVLSEASQGSRHTLHVCTSTARAITAFIPDKPVDSYVNLAFRTPEGDLPTGVAPAYDVETGKVMLPALAPGTYHLQAYWFANGKDQRFDRVLVVPEDVQNNLSLDPTVYSVAGSVHMDGGTSETLGELSVVANCGQFGSMAQSKALVTSDGSFAFRELAAPDCSFSIGGVGSVSVTSMEVNDKQVQYGRTVLKPFPNVNRVDLIATTARGSLSGKVDGKGAEAGSGVVACNLGSGECQKTKADANGVFRFSGLGSGSYRISAWPKLDPIEYRVPAFMQPFTSSSGEVQVKANEATEVSVPLSHAY